MNVWDTKNKPNRHVVYVKNLPLSNELEECTWPAEASTGGVRKTESLQYPEISCNIKQLALGVRNSSQLRAITQTYCTYVYLDHVKLKVITKIVSLTMSE